MPRIYPDATGLVAKTTFDLNVAVTVKDFNKILVVVSLLHRMVLKRMIIRIGVWQLTH